MIVDLLQPMKLAISECFSPCNARSIIILRARSESSSCLPRLPEISVPKDLIFVV